MKISLFGNGTVDVSDDAKVSDLAEVLHEDVELWVDDPRYVTVYDMKGYHVCWDRDALLRDELSSGDTCIAYIVPGKFYFVEGGWGHHMIDMDCVHLIPDPVSIKLRFRFDHYNIGYFYEELVVNGQLTIQELIEILQETIIYWGPVDGWAVYDVPVFLPSGDALDVKGDDRIGDLHGLKCLFLTIS